MDICVFMGVNCEALFDSSGNVIGGRDLLKAGYSSRRFNCLLYSYCLMLNRIFEPLFHTMSFKTSKKNK